MERGKTFFITRFLLGALGAFGALFFVVPGVRALTLSPISVEFQAAPGQTYETTVKLINETAQTEILYPETVLFTAAGETGDPTFDFSVPAEGLATWISVQPGPITLDPEERVELPVTVTVPADAEPGGHYATLFFANTPPEPENGGQVTIGTKIGMLLLARVEGDIIEQANIEEFSLADGGTLTRLPAEFVIRYRNTGNVHLRPTGGISITNVFGGETAVPVNLSKGSTLPDQIRRYDAVWEKATLKDETGNIWTRFWTAFSNEKNNFAFGKYKAIVTMTAGQSATLSDGATVSFWVIPWHILLVTAIILALIVLALVFGIRHYNRWIIRRAGGTKSN